MSQKKVLTFQEIIAALNHYWSENGCVIRQGYDLEMGAGTFNPATFIDSLAPGRRCNAYVEPCRRPTDGRYGQNPNRLQAYYQYQVFMKPAPKDFQTLYLNSLAAIGIDIQKHDIRFVHDDWESPTLGAWGLGWEVWLDGMEVTQFTYFQQIGGLALQQIPGEITYGLERLATYIQGVDSIFDIEWTDGVMYRDIHMQSEVEFSAYNFDVADTDFNFEMFRHYERETGRCLDKELTLPAYDAVIKASHAFNMLDARGVISVTERMGYILRIRKLSKAVAEQYRQRFPAPIIEEEVVSIERSDEGRESVEGVADFILEVGSEELPASFVNTGMNGLEKAILALLKKEGIAFASLQKFGTPRRVGIILRGLEKGKAARRELRKGPPVARLFDATGEPTKMAIGFAKKCGLELPSRERLEKASEDDDFFVKKIGEAAILHAQINIPKTSTRTILQAQLKKIILGIDYPKKMRWTDSALEYARPLRWILCQFDGTKVPFRIGDIEAGLTTEGHPVLGPGKPIAIASVDSFFDTLSAAHVIADQHQRRAIICAQLDRIVSEHQASVPMREKVIDEVLHLTENPQLCAIRFDTRYLSVPKEILISEMIEHQKYFALVDGNENLLNTFIVTSNGIQGDNVERGNLKVLTARLSDGKFLYEADLKESQENRVSALDQVTFIEGLDSVGTKVKRLQKHCVAINKNIGLNADRVDRAAYLCKNDLTSKVVYDFPDLQGLMGGYYAQENGEDDGVVSAIRHHYRPLGQRDQLPETQLGCVISLADKLDNVIAVFGMGLKPGATSDPFAIRRQVLGIIRIVIEVKMTIPLMSLVGTCIDHFDGMLKVSKNALIDDLKTYIGKRIETIFRQYDLEADEISASLNTPFDDVYDLYQRISALREFRKTKTFSNLLEVYRRSRNILAKEKTTYVVREKFLVDDCEKRLFELLSDSDMPFEKAVVERNYKEAFALLSQLQQPLEDLFDSERGVRIMDDNPDVRGNRLGLLQCITARFFRLLDFSKITRN